MFSFLNHKVYSDYILHSLLKDASAMVWNVADPAYVLCQIILPNFVARWPVDCCR